MGVPGFFLWFLKKYKNKKFVFKKDDREYVSNIIKKVSIQYKSQVFVPHITAYGLVDVDLHVLNENFLSISFLLFFNHNFKISFADEKSKSCNNFSNFPKAFFRL